MPGKVICSIVSRPRRSLRLQQLQQQQEKSSKERRSNRKRKKSDKRPIDSRTLPNAVRPVSSKDLDDRICLTLHRIEWLERRSTTDNISVQCTTRLSALHRPSFEEHAFRLSGLKSTQFGHHAVRIQIALVEHGWHTEEQENFPQDTLDLQELEEIQCHHPSFAEEVLRGANVGEDVGWEREACHTGVPPLPVLPSLSFDHPGGRTGCARDPLLSAKAW